MNKKDIVSKMEDIEYEIRSKQDEVDKLEDEIYDLKEEWNKLDEILEKESRQHAQAILERNDN